MFTIKAVLFWCLASFLIHLNACQARDEHFPEAMAASTKCRVYVASPYGFAESTSDFMKTRFYPEIRQDCEAIDPWRHDPSRLPPPMKLGGLNTQDIDSADGVIAVLDGPDVDSGTAAEIGYAAAKGKWIIGYRGDFRRTGEQPQVTVNLQVEYFICKNGGTILKNYLELREEIQRTRLESTRIKRMSEYEHTGICPDKH